MPITINGSGTITGLSAGGLPDGTVQPADLSTGAPYWDTSGNVGIGTSSPNYRLQVKPATNQNFSVGGSVNIANSVSLAAVNDANNANIPIEMRYATTFAFIDSGTERARIDSSGNLLVGTTSNGGVGITIQNQSANSGAPYLLLNKSFNGNTTGVYFQYNGTSVGSITYSNTATAYNTSSDYRLKENVQPMTGAIARVSALKPVRYNWKLDGSDGEGFIAHELAEVVPQCVTGEKDAVDADGNPVYQGIDTSFLVATLTAAIQELNAKVDAQAAEIAALKGAA